MYIIYIYCNPDKHNPWETITITLLIIPIFNKN